MNASTCCSCGEPGAHGTIDECLHALRRARAGFGDAPAMKQAPPVDPVQQVCVRRLRPTGGHYLAAVVATTTEAFQWLRMYGKVDRRYFIDGHGTRATVDRSGRPKGFS